MFEPLLPAETNAALPKYDYKIIRPNGRVSPKQTDVTKTWQRVREQLQKQAGSRADEQL